MSHETWGQQRTFTGTNAHPLRALSSELQELSFELLGNKYFLNKFLKYLLNK